MPRNADKRLSIVDLIGEATAYDKKQALEEKRTKSWCKSFCAFANGEGGALIFGIADDCAVVGLDNPEEVANKVSEITKSRLDPIPRLSGGICAGKVGQSNWSPHPERWLPAEA